MRGNGSGGGTAAEEEEEEQWRAKMVVDLNLKEEIGGDDLEFIRLKNRKRVGRWGLVFGTRQSFMIPQTFSFLMFLFTYIIINFFPFINK